LITLIDFIRANPGDSYALGAALSWAFAVVLFKQSGERLPPLALNLFKNAVACVCLGATLLLWPGAYEALRAFTAHDILVLSISGVLGIAVADSLFFAGLNRVGVGIMSVVDCTYTPFVFLFAWLLLGEVLGWQHAAGAALIIVAILICARLKPPADRTHRDLLIGIACGVGAMAATGLGITLAKPVLHERSLLWATTFRVLAGGLFLFAFFAPRLRDPELMRLLRPSPIWYKALPGSFLGTYVSMLFWIGGFKYSPAARAAILNQSTIIFAILLAALFLKEPLTSRKLLAVGLAVAGVLVATLLNGDATAVTPLEPAP